MLSVHSAATVRVVPEGRGPLGVRARVSVAICRTLGPMRAAASTPSVEVGGHSVPPRGVEALQLTARLHGPSTIVRPAIRIQWEIPGVSLSLGGRRREGKRGGGGEAAVTHHIWLCRLYRSLIL